MNRVFSAACLFALALVPLTAAVSAEINFTPTIDRYMSEGAEYANASFKDGKKNVSIAVPRTWSCRGDAARLQFIPPNQSFAEGIIQSVPTKTVIRFDEPTVKAIEQQVLAELPPGSQDAKVVAQQENPVLLNQNLSYEFTVTYKTVGQTFLRNVVIVSCPEQALIFKFTAPKAVFDGLNHSFRQSIYSWHWTDPEPAKTATAVVQNTVQK